MSEGIPLSDRVEALVIRGILGAALLVPYRWRIPLVGWITSRIIAPVAGWRRRVRDNLALVFPDMPEAEVRRMERAVPDNVGRTLIEAFSGRDFIERVENTPLEGPGVEALEAAISAGRPVIFVTAHIGNYDAMRSVFARRGQFVANLYKPMKNEAFNPSYVRALSTVGHPLFPTDRKGIAQFVDHLRNGGMVGLVADVGRTNAPLLTFFGHPAHTPLSAAEWALKYDALMVPLFGLRQPSGLDFRIHVAEPIPKGTPEEMMQAFNDLVESIVREHMDQWYWIHRRWKRAKG